MNVTVSDIFKLPFSCRACACKAANVQVTISELVDYNFEQALRAAKLQDEDNEMELSCFTVTASRYCAHCYGPEFTTLARVENMRVMDEARQTALNSLFHKIRGQ